VRLRPELTPEQALANLSQATNTLRTATQVMGGDVRVAEAYVGAVSDVERTLRATFIDVRLNLLRTQRFWAIHALAGARLIEMVNDERDAQTQRLDAYVSRIRDLAARFSGDVPLAVVDTHVLLHYRLFDEVDWPAIVGAENVRLVVPLRVIDELDAKKAGRRQELGDRARTVIRHLEETLARNGDVREGVRLEVVALAELDPDTYGAPPLLADIEIIEVSEGLSSYAGGGMAHLITGDLGMRIRARDRSLLVVGMPDEYSLPAKDSTKPDTAT
jgi:hypothetical protein